MINHARTLILNESYRDRPGLGELGEEYVPTEFNVLDYPEYLQKARQVLIGSAGEPTFQNYRLAQLMALAHGNQYTEELLLSFDTRYTYKPYQTNFLSFDFSTEVEKINDQGMSITTGGTQSADEARGRAFFRWMITTEAGPRILVEEQITRRKWYYDITLDGEKALPIELENGLLLTLHVPLGSWQTDARWLMTSIVRPRRDLGLLVSSFNTLGAKSLAALFRDTPATFYQLWIKGISLVDQIGGVLGAFLHKAEKVRTGG